VISSGRRVAEFSVPHSGDGITALIDKLLKYSEGNPASVGFAIEMPRGALVEALLDAGFHGYSINPKQVDRFRDRHSVAGSKDDSLDSFVLADSLRTDLALFRRIAVDDPLIIQIREISRADEELGTELNRLTNRLREQLHRYFPQALELSKSATDPWLWSLLALANTPAKARALRRNKVERLLRDHGIRRVTTEDVFEALSKPDLYVAPGAVEAAASHVALLIPRVQLAHEQRKACEAMLENLLEAISKDETVGNKNEHRDVAIILSLTGIGTRVAATMLGEASQILAEKNYHVMRSLGQAAPVTRRSGRATCVLMRRACNRRLARAIRISADVHRLHDPRARALYAALRARGHNHNRALRTVADHMLRTLFAMLRDRTLYDPNRAARVRPEQQAQAA
jgi:hypothetical protein